MVEAFGIDAHFGLEGGGWFFVVGDHGDVYGDIGGRWGYLALMVFTNWDIHGNLWSVDRYIEVGGGLYCISFLFHSQFD